MGISVADNFDHKSKKPLDARTSYSTLALMKAVTDANINEGCLAYCAETDKYYKFLSTNTVDETTGKWREFSSGGGGGSSYTAGDGIDIINGVISTKQSEEGDIDEIVDVLPSGGGSSSSYVYNSATDLSTTIGGTQTVTLSNLTRSDDSTVNPTASDIAVGKTIISDTAGTIGVATAIASSNVTVSTISIAGSSGGDYGSLFHFYTTYNDAIGNTVTITDEDNNTYTGVIGNDKTCDIAVASVGNLRISVNNEYFTTIQYPINYYSRYVVQLIFYDYYVGNNLSYATAYGYANEYVSGGLMEYENTIMIVNTDPYYSTNSDIQNLAWNNMTRYPQSHSPIGDVEVNTVSNKLTLTFKVNGYVVISDVSSDTNSMSAMISRGNVFSTKLIAKDETLTIPISYSTWVSFYKIL